MKTVQFKYSNHAWGFNEEELYVIDFEKKLYAHFNKGELDDHLSLPDNLLATMQSYFERIYILIFRKMYLLMMRLCGH